MGCVGSSLVPNTSFDVQKTSVVKYLFSEFHIIDCVLVLLFLSQSLTTNMKTILMHNTTYLDDIIFSD